MLFFCLQKTWQVSDARTSSQTTLKWGSGGGLLNRTVRDFPNILKAYGQDCSLPYWFRANFCGFVCIDLLVGRISFVCIRQSLRTEVSIEATVDVALQNLSLLLNCSLTQLPHSGLLFPLRQNFIFRQYAIVVCSE